MIFLKVFKQLQPNVLFTAHEHKSKIITYNTYEKKDRQIQATDPKSTTNKFEFSFNSGFLYEFMVPTCSYRMGTANMGYGYAIIGEFCASQICEILFSLF